MRSFWLHSNKNITIPKDLSSLQSNRFLPSSDGVAVYFFNPDEYNGTSNQWNYTYEIWKMNTDGTLSNLPFIIPNDLQFLVPIHLGNGFFLINNSQNGTSFWWCAL